MLAACEAIRRGEWPVWSDERFPDELASLGIFDCIPVRTEQFEHFVGIAQTWAPQDGDGAERLAGSVIEQGQLPFGAVQNGGRER